jgi:hypothetical protein
MSRREEGEMKKYAVALWVAVWVIGLTSGCGGEDQADKLPLRLNLREGESLSLRMVTDQNISQTVLGQEQEITQKIGFDFTFLIDAVDADGTAMVQVTYDWVMMEQDGPTGKIVYDSADPPARVPDLAVGFAALVGRGFAMRLSAEGRVQDIQGVDALITGLLEELDLPEGAEADAIEQSFRDQFGEEALKENMENMMAVYPEEPVGIGDSWARKIVISKGFPMILDNTWTLTAREGGVATIEVHSTVEPNPDAEPLQMGPIQLSYEIAGEQQGTIELNESTGWTIGAELRRALSGEIEMGDTSWPISINSMITMEEPRQ